MMTPRAGPLFLALALVLAVLPMMAGACVVGGAREVTVPEVPGDAEPGVAEVFTLARAGHEAGLLHLGVYFDAGVYVTQDPARAARFYRAAIRAGDDSLAPLLLARLHGEGRGVAFAPELVRHYTRLAAAGDVGEPIRAVLWQTLDPFFGSGWAPEDVYQRALEWWQAAKARAPVAQWRLGQRYWHGWGLPQCREMGEVFLFRAKIDGGPVLDFLYSAHRLQFPSESGLATLRDDYTWRMDLYMVASAGLPVAARALGRELFHGHRGPRQPLGAYYWLRQAEQSGLQVSHNLDALWRDIPPFRRMWYRHIPKDLGRNHYLFRPRRTE